MIRLLIWCKPLAKYILIAWLISVVTMSSIPSLPTLKIHTAGKDIRLDYLIHFCEYGIMALLAYLSFAGKRLQMDFKRWGFLTSALIFFAYLDELHQKFIPGRTYNVKDILSDISGILVALLFCIIVFRIATKRMTISDHK